MHQSEGLRIGVVGHRWNRIPPAMAATLEATLRRAFSEVPPGDTTLVTGMAEGTDLAACAVRPEGWSLEAVLPLPRRQWRATLVDASGVRASELATFDRALTCARVVVPEPDARAPAFEAVGRYIAETCDRIVAVWNGADGPSGGTSFVVGLAHKRGIPVQVLWPLDLSLRGAEALGREG